MQTGKASFDLLCRTDLLPDCFVKKSDLAKEYFEIYREIHDPFETRFRKELAVRADFDFIEQFYGEYAWAKKKHSDGSHWWVIDREGQIQTPMYKGNFQKTPFIDGRGWVAKYPILNNPAGRNDVKLTLNGRGLDLVEQFYVHSAKFEGFEGDGIILVKDYVASNQERDYYLDRDGKIFKCEAEYRPLTTFGCGRAWVEIAGAPAIVDSDGVIIKRFHDLKIDNILVFNFYDNQTWLRVGPKPYKYMLLDINGREICAKDDPEIESIGSRREGRSVKKMKDNCLWLLNEKGREIAGPFFDVGLFENGATAVWPIGKSSKQFLVDRSGRRISEDGWIRKFGDGVFFFEDRGQYWLVNKNGQKMCDHTFTIDKIVSRDLALVWSDHKHCYINEWGEEIFDA